MLQRTFAKLIPGTALERFEPVSIVAFSDGDNAATAGVSDTLRVIQGSYSGTSGAVVYDEVIPEEPSETIPEPRLDFVTTPVFFDVEEPLFETGGVSGVISDYVDLTDVVGFFLSSDNPGDYDNLDPAFPLRGKLVEDPETGGTVYYSLRFVSDVIPEPATFILLGTGLLFMGFIRRRRSH